MTFLEVLSSCQAGGRNITSETERRRMKKIYLNQYSSFSKSTSKSIASRIRYEVPNKESPESDNYNDKKSVFAYHDNRVSIIP